MRSLTLRTVTPGTARSASTISSECAASAAEQVTSTVSPSDRDSTTSIAVTDAAGRADGRRDPADARRIAVGGEPDGQRVGRRGDRAAPARAARGWLLRGVSQAAADGGRTVSVLIATAMVAPAAARRHSGYRERPSSRMAGKLRPSASALMPVQNWRNEGLRSGVDRPSSPASGPVWSSRTVSTVEPSSWPSRWYVRSMTASPDRQPAPPAHDLARAGSR